MIRHLKTLAKMRRIMRRGEFVGDAPVLKMTLFMEREAPSDYTPQARAMHDINFAPINLADLNRLPSHTFGHAYARFMARNKLQPFNFSDEIEPLFERYPITIRYVRVHDMIHTLLNFDTTLAGEIGVYAFVGEQHYTPTLDWAARVADRLSFIPFWQRTRVKAAQARGKMLARDAAVMVATPLESLFASSLQEVRHTLVPHYTAEPAPPAKQQTAA